MNTFQLNTFDFNLNITGNHPVLRHHVVHQNPLVPGVTWINIIAQALENLSVPLNQIEIHDIVFREALSVPIGEQSNINLCFDASTQQLRISSNDGKKLHCQCRLTAVDTIEELKSIDWKALTKNAKRRPLEEVYANARKLNIVHGDWMKGQGDAWLNDHEVVAKIKLSESAAATHTNYCLHPALMDCATLVPFAAGGFGIDPNVPFIPISIKRVRIHGSMFSSSVVVTELSDGCVHNEDILHHDLTLLDDTGLPLVEVQCLSAKRIRSAESLQKTAQQTNSEDTIPAHSAGGVPNAPIKETGPKTSGCTKRLLTQFVVSHSNLSSIDDTSQGFYDLGLDSQTLLELSSLLEEELGATLYPTLLYEHGSVDQLDSWLNEQGLSLPDPGSNKVLNAAEGVALSLTDSTNADTAETNACTIALEETSLLAWIKNFIQKLAGLDSLPADDAGFYELGLDSSQLLQVSSDLEEEFDIELYPTLAYEYGTVNSLTTYLAEQGVTIAASSQQDARPVDDTADSLQNPAIPSSVVESSTVAMIDKSRDIATFVSLDWSRKDVTEKSSTSGWFALNRSTFAGFQSWSGQQNCSGLVWQLSPSTEADSIANLLLDVQLQTQSLLKEFSTLKLLICVEGEAAAAALVPFFRSVARENPRFRGRIVSGAREADYQRETGDFARGFEWIALYKR